MISADNFYWIVYNTLLRPVGLDCWYFYPWGTMDNFSAYEFSTREVGREQHVIFHWDQEPIWSNSLGKYDQFSFNYNNPGQYLCVLANSEHSELKQQVVRERNMMDWYFFYHGFLALDWFRDAEHIDFDTAPIRRFSSYNHIVKNQRAYRMALTARLLDLGLDQCADISFHGSQQDCWCEVHDQFTLLSNQDKDHIVKNLVSNPSLPFVLDHLQVDGILSAHFGYHEYSLWQRSFLHIVNETVFYPSKLHLTEKIFKPIVAMRPFVLVGAPGNLAYLKSYGFRTFADWIDESYDLEYDNDTRLDMIAREVQKICSMTNSELTTMHTDMRSVLQFNKRHFFSGFRQFIVDEMVENFNKSVIMWNSMSHTDKQVTLHPDLQSAKNILLRSTA